MRSYCSGENASNFPPELDIKEISEIVGVAGRGYGWTRANCGVVSTAGRAGRKS